MSGKSFTNKDGWEVTETINSRFDPVSGKLLDQGKQINEYLYKDDVYQSKTTRYDQDGKLLGIDKWGDGPLLDGKKKVIGYYSFNEYYDAKGILKDADRQETSYLFDAQDIVTFGVTYLEKHFGTTPIVPPHEAVERSCEPSG